MGSPPVPDAPPPEADVTAPAPPEVPSPPFDLLCPSLEGLLPDIPNLLPAGLGLSFGLSPIGFALCGFALPFPFLPNLLPPIPFPDLSLPIPNLFFALCLKCDLADPIDADAGFGGGRVAGADPNVDPQYPNA